MVCLKAILAEDGNSQGGVGTIVWDQSQGWNIESTQFNRPDVVIYEVASGKWTPLIG